MKLLKAIITVIRFPNLVFIFLTQLLAYHFLIGKYLQQHHLPSLLQGIHFYLFAFSTVLIAAAGYIINDYFDIGIDAVNKPSRVTIEKIFKRRTIIIWHIALNTLALIMVSYIALQFLQLRYVLCQLFSIFLLTIYSTTFKRKLIIGNISIAILTAMTLFSLALYEAHFPITDFKSKSIILFYLYLIFAFLITFAREVIKDIEDIKGDGLQNCKTIPLVWGIQSAKNFVYMVLAILLVLFVLLMTMIIESNFILLFYWIAFIILPIAYLFYQIHLANTAAHFHRISTMLKLITLAGILSMILT